MNGETKTRISRLGQYEGYSEPVYDGRKRYSIYFKTGDGTDLALDYYIPTRNGEEAGAPLPVLFHYTPYGRVSYRRTHAPDAADGDSLRFTGLEGFLELSRFGYVIAIASVRGTDASFGARVTVNSRREAQDGKEIAEWLVRQPFCSGKLGTAGFSYTGGTQLEILSTGTGAVTAAFIGMTDWDKYDGWVRGGIPRAFGHNPDTDYGSTEEEVRRTVEQIVADTVPIDGDEDRVLLRKAVWEHVASGDQVSVQRDLNWRDSVLERTGKQHWKEISISSYAENVRASGAAVYLAGGIYDVFRKETIQLYRNLPLQTKLLLGPWYHTDRKTEVDWEVEMLRWFDYWLKGIENGVTDGPQVAFRVGSYNFEQHSVRGPGTGFYREEAAWPVSGGTRAVYYLRSDEVLTGSVYENGALTEDGPETERTVSYPAEYGCTTGVDSTLTTDGRTGKGLDQIGQTFSTAPLTQELQIIGHPMAYVTLSLEDPGWMTENYDADVFVAISDWNPETDEAFLISSGQLRASLRRESADCPYDTAGLPWHRCNLGDNEYLTKGEKYRLKIDLLPTAYCIPMGHSLRFTVSHSRANCYYFGRKAYEADPQCIVPRMKLYLGGGDASRIELPDLYE